MDMPIAVEPVPRSRWRKMALALLGCCLALGLALPLGARLFIHRAARPWVCAPAAVPPCRVAVVLGARIYPGGQLSPLLAARVQQAAGLYRAGKVRKLLMSGDNRVSHYNEPERMRDYAVSLGVPARDVAMDYAGRRTYDSVYRARHIFGLDRCIVVSQDFHVDRAVFLARRLGLEAWGVPAPAPGLSGTKAGLREYAASVLALADAYLWRPRPVGGRPEKI